MPNQKETTTIQEEIRKWIEETAEKGFGLNWNEAAYLADFILEYLKSKGVVIKSDGEVSDICSAFHSDECHGGCMLAIAVEELI